MTVALRYSVRSDVGLIREGNEDSAYAGPHLLAIADGMGGHAAGEVASAVAISALAPLDIDTAGVDMLQVLADAVANANARLREITLSDPGTEGMGTTLTALLWSDDQVAVCHIGDSRGYLLRDGTLYQITKDHTLVQSLVDHGDLTREDAANHPQRSLVMRALQASIPADPDLAIMQAELGDRFMLCSDGLSDVVTDETLHKTMMEFAELDECVAQLVDLAIRSGGPDNITCIMADVIDAEAGPGTPTEQPQFVGAVATGGPPDAPRADSPATRAHELTRAARAPDNSGEAGADGNGNGNGDQASGDQASGEAQATGETQADDAAEQASGPGAATDLSEPDDQIAGGRRRRRWPLVSLTLLVLLGVVGAGGYYGWRATQDEYFVGVSHGHVAVFRGVNQPIAGFSLASVVRQTNIPVSALPLTEAVQVRDTISALTLRQADQTVTRIQQGYQCGIALTAISRWLASRPRPVVHHRAKVVRHNALGVHRKAATARPQTRTSRSAARSTGPAAPRYPARPLLPGYCSAYPGAGG